MPTSPPNIFRISATVSLDRGDPRQEAFCDGDRMLDGGDYPILSFHTPPNARTRRTPHLWCREYVAPLDAVVSADPERMRAQLLQFARAVFDDVRARRGSDTGATSSGAANR